MVVEWIKRHWDVIVIILTAIGAAVLFAVIALRPMPGPPAGY